MDVLREFAALEQRVYHLIGNHCLYNFPRAELNARLGECLFGGVGTTSTRVGSRIDECSKSTHCLVCSTSVTVATLG